MYAQLVVDLIYRRHGEKFGNLLHVDQQRSKIDAVQRLHQDVKDREGPTYVMFFDITKITGLLNVVELLKPLDINPSEEQLLLALFHNRRVVVEYRGFPAQPFSYAGLFTEGCPIMRLIISLIMGTLHRGLANLKNPVFACSHGGNMAKT